MEKWSFDEQFNAFNSTGEAIGPSGDRIGRKKKPAGEGGGSVAAYKGIAKKRARGDEGGGFEEAKTSDVSAAESKRHEDRVDGGEEEYIDVGDEEVDGIWAPEKPIVPQSDFEAGTMSEEQAKYREEYLESKASRKREFSESEVSSTLVLIVKSICNCHVSVSRILIYHKMQSDSLLTGGTKERWDT